jgi:hypothetical protein
MMDQDHIITAMLEHSIHINVRQIALDDIRNGCTQVLHLAQEALTSMKVVAKVVIVDVLKQEGMSRLGHLATCIAPHSDCNQRTSNIF